MKEIKKNISRNKSRIASGALTGVTMLVGGMEVAVAVPIMTMQTKSSPSVEFNPDGSLAGGASSGDNILSFDLFDSNLGDLLGVEISIAETTVSIDPGFEGISAQANQDYDFSGTFVIDFSTQMSSSEPFDNPWFSTTLGQIFRCDETGSSCPATGATSADVAKSAEYLSSNENLDAFTKSGGGSFDVTFGITEVSPDAINVGGPFNGEPLFRWSGDEQNFNIKYTYQPASIPEPGSLALATLGLATFMRSRRRK